MWENTGIERLSFFNDEREIKPLRIDRIRVTHIFLSSTKKIFQVIIKNNIFIFIIKIYFY